MRGFQRFLFVCFPSFTKINLSGAQSDRLGAGYPPSPGFSLLGLQNQDWDHNANPGTLIHDAGI